jgi:hypothetical protein
MRHSVRFVFALVLAAAPAAAQEAPPPASPGSIAAAPGAPPAAEPRIRFDREVFSYGGRARRDPFRPLTASTAGPLFEDLKLNGILYSPVPAESIVLLSDATRRQYRLRRGDSVGNATVVDIGESRVVFSVIDFGIRRQEVLDMKANKEGTTR